MGKNYNSSRLVNGLSVDASGNVGIGTSSPAFGLDILGTTAASSILRVSYSGFASVFLQAFNGIGYTGTLTNDAFAISTNNTERMRITNTGNVGIGTSSPSDRLHILGTGANTQTLLLESSFSNANAYIVHKSPNKNYAAGLSGDLSNSYIIYDSTVGAARMTITSGGSVLINRSTNPYESVYKFIINNGTNLNIGFGKQEGEMSIEGFNDAINASIPLRIYGNPIKLMTTTSVISDLYVGGQAYKPGGGSWANSSDIRLKENVKTIDNALDKVLQLRGVTFDWKEGYTEFGKKESAGFIADEIMEVFPEWVSETKTNDAQKEIVNDYKIKSLSLPFHFDALLVEAIKELKGELDSLKAQINN